MILDPKIDKAGREAKGLNTSESSLIDFMPRHDLVDRFCLDHPGREMWMWIDSLSSVRLYLDRVLVRPADFDFVSCPMFQWIGQTDYKLVRLSLWLENRSSLDGYWKFNTSLLEIQNFWDWLESLIQHAPVGEVVGNRWWDSLKYKIRDFVIKYGRKLKLDKTKKAKSLDDRISWAVKERLP